MSLESEYRKLVVMTVQETEPASESILISFIDCPISLGVRKDFLEERGFSEIQAGQAVLVKGRNGNDDLSLWGLDTVEDLQPALD